MTRRKSLAASAPKEMWEVLVPTSDRRGRKFGVKFHQQWDKEVEKITGGMTLSAPSKGRWHHKGERIEEHMIPVRIMCTEVEVNTIVDFTKVHYDQITVMAYRISDKVILR